MSQTAKKAKARDQKREAVFEAAADTFARYGFRRTAMNDIAKAAGISRPALYLMFENKEDLFRELVTHLQDAALAEATAALVGAGPWGDRFTGAILAYKRVLYEPIAASPHGEELIDVNLSIAADLMMKGHDEFVAALTRAIKDGIKNSEVSFESMALKPKEFTELILASIDGVKKSATSVEDFNRQAAQLITIFLSGIKTA